LCSDTEMSNEYMKYHERKIHHYIIPGTAGKCTVGFTYSRSPELMKMIQDNFSAAVNQPSYEPTLDSIRRTLENLLAEKSDVIRDNLQGLDMLCGVTLESGPVALYKTEGTNLRPVPHFDFLGVGDCSLLRYLFPVLMGDEELIGEEFTVSIAEKLGAYMIAKAKDHIVGCGGKTNMITLKPDGCVHLGDVIAWAYEDELGILEHTFTKLIKATLNSKVSGEQLDTKAADFFYQLKKFRQIV